MMKQNNIRNLLLLLFLLFSNARDEHYSVTFNVTSMNVDLLRVLVHASAYALRNNTHKRRM